MSQNLSITPQYFLNRLQNTEDDFCVLDVRSLWEIQESPLEDKRVKHIEMQDIPSQMQNLSKKKEIFCLCLSGARSWQVTQFLNANGFIVKNIEGGIQNVLFLQRLG